MFFKVNDSCVLLVCSLQLFDCFIYVHQKLRLTLTGPSASEAMLLRTEDLVIFKLCHDVTGDDVLHHLAGYACECDGAVLFCHVSSSLLGDRQISGRVATFQFSRSFGRAR